MKILGQPPPLTVRQMPEKNTVMLDSWFSVGGAASNKMGVLKAEDTDGSIGNLNGLLANTVTSIGYPLTVRDGLAAGTPVAVTFCRTF